jgi:hypothetical protein
MRETGSSSAVVLGILLVVSALFLGGSMFAQLALRGLRRAEAYDQLKERLEEEAERVIRFLQDDPTPFADSPHDPVWEQVRALEGVGLEEISSYLGLNWIRRELLQSMNVLKPGKTAQELQLFREETGLHLALDPLFLAFIDRENINKLFTAYNFFNINIADEFVLRRLHLVRGSDKHAAERFRLKVQEARLSKKEIESHELRDFLGEADYRLLFPVLNTEAVMNIHFAPREVLAALFACYEVPLGKANEILNLRRFSQWSEEQLEERIGLPFAESPLHHFLGPRSWFWKITVRSEGAVLTWIVARVPLEAGGAKTELRLVEEGYEA